MRYPITSLVMLTSLGACTAPASSTEVAGQTSQAVTAGPNNGQYTLNPSYSLNECVGTAYAATGDGSLGQLWNCATNGDPQWTLAQVSSGVYEIRQALSGLCLVIAGAGPNYGAGTPLILWTCQGQPGSRWQISPDGSNWEFHSNDNTSFCIDATNFGGDGTTMQIYYCSNGTNQQYLLNPFVPASTSASTLSAALSVSQTSTSQYSAKVTVTNSSNAIATNWQVGLNLNQSNVSNGAGYGGVQGITNGSVYYNDGLAILTPANGQALASGSSVSVSFTGNITGSNWAPTIASVDGIAGSSAPMLNDGVDHVARGAATAAINVMEAYETTRSAADQQDDIVVDSHVYMVSSDGSQIVFDPNSSIVQGSNVNQATVSALAAAQTDPQVASYLVAGLLSCFGDSNGNSVWGFNAAAVKGWSYTTTPQTINMPAPGGWNFSTNFTRVGANVGGAERIQLTMTVNNGNDPFFGILTDNPYVSMYGYSNMLSKFHGGNDLQCSPFNGPGGTANPYFVISLNGSVINARAVPAEITCAASSNCVGTAVIDPVAYASPGQFYSASGSLIGPSTNPFVLDPNVVTGYDPDHEGQWAQDPSGNWGEFSKKTLLAGEYWYKWSMCSGGKFKASGC